MPTEPTEEVLITTPLDDLRSDLVVTAHYSNGTTQILPNFKYDIEASFGYEGENNVIIRYGGKTT